MNISPLDIRKHEFKKSFRGFDVDEVAAYLDMVSIEFENIIRENSVLSERNNNFDNQLKKYRDIESTLQETLLSAQRAREETINTAKKQAELIIREAEVKAASIVEGGRRELSTLRSSFNELKVHKDAYYAKLKALVRSQMEMLEEHDFPEEKIYEATLSSEAKREDAVRPDYERRADPAPQNQPEPPKEAPKPPREIDPETASAPLNRLERREYSDDDIDPLF